MSQLNKDERVLREYDRALRLRYAWDQPTVLVERKTFRGRYGSIGPSGIVWLPDAGRRREEGHVFVCSIPRAQFRVGDLLEILKESDMWRRWDSKAKPVWMAHEERDARHKKQIVKNRKDTVRYKAEDVWNRYAWTSKSRVSVPERIR